MCPRFLREFEAFKSAEKACWDILLRDLPEAAPMPQPVIDAAMDRTLEQLWRVLDETSTEGRLAAAQVLPPPLPGKRECGLEAHLPYFNAGLRALELIAQEVEREHAPQTGQAPGADCDELLFAFELLVQCQLEELCRTCRRAGECRYGDARKCPRAQAGLPTGVEETAPGSAHRRERRARSRRSRRSA